MKKFAVVLSAMSLALGAEATAIVKITESAPGAGKLTAKSMLSYDCFIIKSETLKKAMGRTPETSLAGVNEVVAYLNADFTTNYKSLLANSDGMMREASWKDFRSTGKSEFGERFGLVVYNPVDGTKTDVDDITYFRVFNFDNRSVAKDSASNAGYWSGWNTASPVPEPSGAMLLLIGVAGVTLRRKRT